MNWITTNVVVGQPDAAENATTADDDEDEDEALNFYYGKPVKTKINYSQFDLDMVFYGVVQCAQKLATQHGACMALVAFWKHAMGTYHLTKKVGIFGHTRLKTMKQQKQQQQ